MESGTQATSPAQGGHELRRRSCKKNLGSLGLCVGVRGLWQCVSAHFSPREEKGCIGRGEWYQERMRGRRCKLKEQRGRDRAAGVCGGRLEQVGRGGIGGGGEEGSSGGTRCYIACGHSLLERS